MSEEPKHQALQRRDQFQSVAVAYQVAPEVATAVYLSLPAIAKSEKHGRGLPATIQVLATCQSLGIDPLKRLVYCAEMDGALITMAHYGVLAGKCEATGQRKDFRAVAVYDGESIEIDPIEGVVKHGFNITKRDGFPIGAYAVGRRGDSKPVVVWVRWKDHAKTKDGKPRATWAAIPETMIEKSATAVWNRKVFPDVNIGVYAAEEFTADHEPVYRASEAAPIMQESEKNNALDANLFFAEAIPEDRQEASKSEDDEAAARKEGLFE